MSKPRLISCFATFWMIKLSLSGSRSGSDNNKNFTCADLCPADIYLLKVNNRNTRIRCEICSKLTLNFEHVIAGWVYTFMLVFLFYYK